MLRIYFYFKKLSNLSNHQIICLGTYMSSVLVSTSLHKIPATFVSMMAMKTTGIGIHFLFCFSVWYIFFQVYILIHFFYVICNSYILINEAIFSYIQNISISYIISFIIYYSVDLKRFRFLT